MTANLKFLFCGDLIGQAGRKAIKEYLPKVISRHAPDLVIANGENSAHGFGISENIYNEMLSDGVHVITTGNHIWDQKSILEDIDRLPNLIRPANYPKNSPGKGYDVFHFPHKPKHKILVVNLMARLFMDPLDDPFAALEEILQDYQLGKNVSAIFVDFHGEASSEKNAFAHAFDGRVTAVVGTHTHTPSADHRILTNGTAYQTDVGMCGDYDSVIGMKKEASIYRFTHKMRGGRLEPAEGHPTLCACLVEFDPTTGLAKNIKAIRVGGWLEEAL